MNSVISREYVEKNYVHKDKVKLNSEKEIALELTKILYSKVNNKKLTILDLENCIFFTYKKYLDLLEDK